MRIERFMAAVTLAMVAVGVAACGGDGDGSGGSGDAVRKPSFAPGSTMERLNQNQRIIVGTKFDQPGFGMKDLDGKHVGFDIEIAKAIATELGIPTDRIEYKEAVSAVREQLIEQGTVDIVVATYTINEKRKERIDFAGPYYVAGQQIMVRKNDDSISGPDSFKEGAKKVCSVTGSTPAANIRQFLKDEASQLVLFKTYQECVEQLKAGQVDAVTTDNVILTGYMASNKDRFKLVGQKFTQEPYGIGLKKGDTQFRDFLNDVLETIAKDGRYEKAWKETSGKYDTSVPTPPPVDRY